MCGASTSGYLPAARHPLSPLPRANSQHRIDAYPSSAFTFRSAGSTISVPATGERHGWRMETVGEVDQTLGNIQPR